MITIMAAQIFLQAGLLCLILYVVAKHEADYSFAKVAMVTAATVAGSTLIEVLLTERIGWLAIFPVFAFVTFMLMTFCWISLGKSIVVVVLFMGVHVAVGMGIQAVERRLTARMAVTGPVSDEDYKMAQEFLLQSFGGAPGETAATNAPGGESETATPVEAPQPEDNAAPAPAAAAPGEAAAPEPVADSQWAEARALLKVGGIMSAGPRGRVALVDGQTVEEGDTVSVEHAGKVYRWRLAAINRDNLDLQPLDVGPSR